MTANAKRPTGDNVEHVGIWWKEPGQPVSYCLEGDEPEDYMLASAKPQLARGPAGAALWDGERFVLLAQPDAVTDEALVQHLLGAFGAGTRIIGCS